MLDGQELQQSKLTLGPFDSQLFAHGKLSVAHFRATPCVLEIVLSVTAFIKIGSRQLPISCIGGVGDMGAVSRTFQSVLHSSGTVAIS